MDSRLTGCIVLVVRVISIELVVIIDPDVSMTTFVSFVAADKSAFPLPV